jgi:hypothetical protein
MLQREKSDKIKESFYYFPYSGVKLGPRIMLGFHLLLVDSIQGNRIAVE